MYLLFALRNVIELKALYTLHLGWVSVKIQVFVTKYIKLYFRNYLSPVHKKLNLFRLLQFQNIIYIFKKNNVNIFRFPTYTLKIIPNKRTFNTSIIFKMKNYISFITNNIVSPEIRTKHFPNKSDTYNNS
jgi:hypothetical protein